MSLFFSPSQFELFDLKNPKIWTFLFFLKYYAQLKLNHKSLKDPYLTLIFTIKLLYTNCWQMLSACDLFQSPCFGHLRDFQQCNFFKSPKKHAKMHDPHQSTSTKMSQCVDSLARKDQTGCQGSWELIRIECLTVPSSFFGQRVQPVSADLHSWITGVVPYLVHVDILFRWFEDVTLLKGS